MRLCTQVLTKKGGGLRFQYPLLQKAPTAGTGSMMIMTQGTTLTTLMKTSPMYGRYGFYEDNIPPRAPVHEPGLAVQGELFKQSPGMATSLLANKESSMRTLSLLGMAERHQTRNYGPATVSSSLTPDSFGLLTKIAEVEKD